MSKMRPHELTLQVLKLGVPVTPTEIDTHVNLKAKDGSVGEYAGKHVWFLRKLGFGIDAVKDGRSVVSYTLVSEPANAEAIRAGAPAKVPKVVKEKTVKTPKAPKTPKSPKVAKALDALKEKVAKTPAATEETPVVAAAPVVRTEADTSRIAMMKAAKARLAMQGLTPPVTEGLASVAVDPDFDAQEQYDSGVRVAMMDY